MIERECLVIPADRATNLIVMRVDSPGGVVSCGDSCNQPVLCVFAKPGYKCASAGVCLSFQLHQVQLARPGIAVAFILAVIFSWNNFVFGIVLAGRETRTLPVAVYNMISFDQLSWGPLAAAALMVTLPVLLLTVAVRVLGVPAVEIEHDDRLGPAKCPLGRTTLGSAGAEQVRQQQAHAAQGANLEQVTPVEAESAAEVGTGGG